MIEKLVLNNYRCFEDCQIEFNDLSIIVGKNNVGKSTLIEAIRIVSVVVNRAQYLNFSSKPDWLDLTEDYMGISPSLDNLEISEKNIFYLYSDPPAIIKAYFTNESYTFIYLGEDAKIFAVLFDNTHRYINSKAAAKNLMLQPINILPQIYPIQAKEPVYQYKTVQKNIDTSLTSRNFRNQLKYYYDDYFDAFQNLSEITWRGLQIKEYSDRQKFDGNLNLLVRDNNFTAEIGWMGHGLQMWLQTMWFLARCEKKSTVVLDEPDVYMHADLQRRLIRLIKNKYNQIMIATHSIEIMAEVESENILPVDSSKNQLTYADNTPLVQKIIENIGSVHNIEIARLFAHKKFLIVEGDVDDIKILSILQGVIYKNTHEPFDILPKTFIEGWGGWQRVIGSIKVFVDNQTNIKTYCILDSDYHLESEKNKRYSEAKKYRLNLHIWQRKEIENYLLLPSAITRIILRQKRNNVNLKICDIETQLDLIADQMKDDTIDNFSTEFKAQDHALTVKTANQEARKLVNLDWNSKKFELIGGKTVISRLSDWSSKKYKVSLNAFKIAREIHSNEIPLEIKEIIKSIETSNDF
jgi:AAA15 family ATPase/GTPase